MFSVLDDNLLAALQFLHLFHTEATPKNHEGTGNTFVSLRVSRGIRCFRVSESSIFWLLKWTFSSPQRVVMRMSLGISC